MYFLKINVSKSVIKIKETKHQLLQTDMIQIFNQIKTKVKERLTKQLFGTIIHVRKED